MWLTWLGFLIQKAADVERSSGNWLSSAYSARPLIFFLWAALKENLRLLIWYELVLLFYFISAVEAAFAYQADWLSAAGLILVVTNFTACMLYIRYRGAAESAPLLPCVFTHHLRSCPWVNQRVTRRGQQYDAIFKRDMAVAEWHQSGDIGTDTAGARCSVCGGLGRGAQ